MKKITLRVATILYPMYEAATKDRWLAWVLVLISTLANGQGKSLDTVSDPLWKQAGDVYKLMSVFVLLAGLFFLGKGIIEGLRGEQGAWVKIGGALLVFAVWFFGVPPLINFLSSQTAGKTFEDVK